MKLFSLVLSNMIIKPWNTFLSLLLLTLGIGLISLILQIEKLVEEQISHNIRGIDLVVGAKGSPLQLILSAVYQVDAPNGNISQAEADKLLTNRLIEFGIPLSYGDTYQGFRIVGSDHRYPKLYQTKLSHGKLWSQALEVTIGALVAQKLGLKVRDTFHGSHGLLDSEQIHDKHTYKVVGIFEQSNSVIDRLILTSTKSVAQLHDHKNTEHNDHETGHEYETKTDSEITAMLIGFRSPLGMIQIPRFVNEQTNMQAAVPVYEIDRLFSFLGVSFEVINIIALSIILISGLSIFISLYNTLKERKNELAFMRVFGATRKQLLFIVLFEGMILSSGGFLLGFICSRIALTSISTSTEANYNYSLHHVYWSSMESWILLSTLGIGIISAIVPAIQAYKLNISTTLADD